jgi:uncharacterized protein (TIGR03118 family)
MRKMTTIAAVLLFCACAYAQNSYTVKDLVTNKTDKHLKNPWGLSRAATSSVGQNQWWVSDQVTGVSTLYTASGVVTKLVVTIPAANGGTGSPTGTVATTLGNFNVNFAFSTLDGTISYWNSQTDVYTGKGCAECHTNYANIVVNNASKNASYQGLTVATNATSNALTYYAANANGGVEAYDATSYAPVTLPPGAFTDSTIPKAYTPAGIQAIGSSIYVTYNRNAGGGTGYVDEYDTNGTLLMRLQTGWFDQPWGVALAPATFGAFSNMILIGNTGSGWIGAYSATNGTFQGFLQSGGTDIKLPGLWGISFGNGNTESGPTDVLYFAAGGKKQTTGVFGSITAN